MNTTHRRNSGFTALEALLVIIMVVIIGVVGYKVYNTKNATDKITENTTAASSSTPSSAVPAINSTSDLGKASQSLDQNDTATQDNADQSQLDSQTAAF